MLLIATTVLLGWCLDLPALLKLQPQWSPMVVNTAICCWLGGLALVSPYLFKPHAALNAYKSLGLIVLTISSIVMLELIFGVDLNIDLPELHRPLQPEYLNPGRMAPNTALALMLFGMGLLFKGFVRNNERLRRKSIQILAVVVSALGWMGIIGYVLTLEYLYNWTGVVRMALLTAIAIVFMGFGLFNLPANTQQHKHGLADNDVERIYYTAALVIILVCLTAGISGFSVLAHRAERLIQEDLLRSSQDRIFFSHTAIAARSERAIVVSKSIQFALLLQQLNKSPDDVSAQKTLTELSSTFEKNGFSALAFEGLNGRIWHSFGKLNQQNTFGVDFHGVYSGRLMWEAGYVLFSRTPIMTDAGDIVGFMRAKQPLKSLDQFREQSLQAGKTSDMVICGATAGLFHCFPSSLESKPFKVPQFYQQQRLPISHALDLNQSGVKTTLDYRGQRVLAAYGPIADTGLGMVIKIDVAEIYAPIKEQLQNTILLIISLIVLGLWLIRKRLIPMVSNIESARLLAENEKARFIAATEGGLDSFYIFDAIRNQQGAIEDFRCSFINQLGSRLISTTPQAFIGKQVCEALPFTRGPLYFDRYLQVIEDGIPIYDEIMLSESQVNANWIARQIVKLGDGVAITARDITERKLAENALKEAQRLQSAIVDSASYSIIATNQKGLIIAMNKAAQRMLWYGEEELVGKSTPEILHDKDEVVIRAKELTAELGVEVQPGFDVFIAKAGDDLPDEREWTYIRKDGSRFPVKLSVTELRDSDRQICGYLGVAYDISEQKRAEEYIKHIALHDVLTGLPNRALFDDRATVALERGKRMNEKVAIALLDLDHFKHINDSLGHHIGDKLLQEVTLRLNQCLRPTDTVARMGGDEFAFVLPDISHPEDLTVIFNRIIQAFKPGIVAANHQLHVSASIGVCIYPDDGEDLQTLLRNADTAMYRAKELGRNNFQIFSREMEQKASKRHNLENALRHALETESFELFYQPQIDFKSNQIIGVEALLRWQRSPGVYLSPIEFIPVAEESGLIVPIGEWVINAACKQAAIFTSELGRPIRMAVNISPRQFKQKNLFEHIVHALQSSALDPSQFEVEITENVLMGDLEHSVQILQQLRSVGVSIALDDFGTGYSSLSYLSKFPVDRIKIDQSFVKNVLTNQEDASLTKVIVTMAKSLGIPAIAEGVESIEQFDFINETGCDEAQGYYIAKPMPSHKLLEFCQSLTQTVT